MPDRSSCMWSKGCISTPKKFRVCSYSEIGDNLRHYVFQWDKYVCSTKGQFLLDTSLIYTNIVWNPAWHAYCDVLSSPHCCFRSPVSFIPETPDKQTIYLRPAEEHCEGSLICLSLGVLVRKADIHLRHPQREASFTKHVQAGLRTDKTNSILSNLVIFEIKCNR